MALMTVTDWLAGYGAVLSTVVAATQFYFSYRDRRSIRISVQHNMEIPNSIDYLGKKLTVINVINDGRRPVTINSVGAIRDPSLSSLIFPTSIPSYPCELTEGKKLTVIAADMPQEMMNSIEWYTASDTAGNEYTNA